MEQFQLGLQEPQTLFLRNRGYRTFSKKVDPLKEAESINPNSTGFGMAPHLVTVAGLFYTAIGRYCTATSRVKTDQPPKTEYHHSIFFDEPEQSLKNQTMSVIRKFLRLLKLKKVYEIKISGQHDHDNKISICAILVAIWQSLKVWELPNNNNQSIEIQKRKKERCIWNSEQMIYRLMRSLKLNLEEKFGAIQTTLKGNDEYFYIENCNYSSDIFLDEYDLVLVRTNTHDDFPEEGFPMLINLDDPWLYRDYFFNKPNDVIGEIMKVLNARRYLRPDEEDPITHALLDIPTATLNSEYGLPVISTIPSLIQGIERQPGGILVVLKKNDFFTQNDWLLTISSKLVESYDSSISRIDFELLEPGKSSNEWKTLDEVEMRHIISLTLEAEENQDLKDVSMDLEKDEIRDVRKTARAVQDQDFFEVGLTSDTVSTKPFVGVAHHIVPVAGSFYMTVNDRCVATCHRFVLKNGNRHVIEMRDHPQKEWMVHKIQQFLETLDFGVFYRITIKGEHDYNGQIAPLSVLVAIWKSLKWWENWYDDDFEDNVWKKFDQFWKVLGQLTLNIPNKKEAFLATVFGTESNFFFCSVYGKDRTLVQRNGIFLENYDLVFLRTNLHPSEFQPNLRFEAAAIRHRLALELIDSNAPCDVFKQIMKLTSNSRIQNGLTSSVIEQECFAAIQEVESKSVEGIENQQGGLLILIKKNEFAPNKDWMLEIADKLKKKVVSGPIVRLDFELLSPGTRSHVEFEFLPHSNYQKNTFTMLFEDEEK